MDRRDRARAPFYGIAMVLMAGFIVWLFAQMTRGEDSTRWALTLGACAVLIGLTAAAVSLWNRRRR